jgi:hypothetical protein
LDLLPAVNAGKVLLLDDAELLRELRGLERRRGTSGRDRIDHRPGQHDDRANAAAGALVLVAAPSHRKIRSAVWGSRHRDVPESAASQTEAEVRRRRMLLRDILSQRR